MPENDGEGRLLSSIRRFAPGLGVAMLFIGGWAAAWQAGREDELILFEPVRTGVESPTVVGVLNAPDRVVDDPARIATGVESVILESARQTALLEGAATDRSNQPSMADDWRPPQPVAYVVEPGDSLLYLAGRFGVDVESLTLLNELGPTGMLRVGQLLLVPALGLPTAGRRSAETEPTLEAAPPETVQLTTPASTGPSPAPPRRELPTVRQAASPVQSRPNSTASPPSPTVAGAAASRLSSLDNRAAGGSPSISLAWPVQGALIQRFGENGHRGIDIAAPTGSTVRAAGSGKVVLAAKSSYGYGWRIVIEHGNGYTSLYGHLSAFHVTQGARVARGQAIGTAGKTGQALAPHLHFELSLNGRPINPLASLP